jgi:hypothetical protein
MHESDHHQAHLSHELIAGAASFEVRRRLSAPHFALADRGRFTATAGGKGIREALRGKREARQPRDGQGAPRWVRRCVRRQDGRDQGCMYYLFEFWVRMF